MRPILGGQEFDGDLPGGSISAKRRKIVIKRKVNNFDIHMRGIIFSEMFPSWAYTLQSMGWNVLEVRVKDLNLTTKCMFANKLNISQCANLVQLNSRTLFVDNLIFWWIQDSQNFTNKIGESIK